MFVAGYIQQYGILETTCDASPEIWTQGLHDLLPKTYKPLNRLIYMDNINVNWTSHKNGNYKDMAVLCVGNELVLAA